MVNCEVLVQFTSKGTCSRENGGKTIPVRENTGNLEILSKHRENSLVCSSWKFPDSEGNDISFNTCRENFLLSWISLSNPVCVCNSDKSRKLEQGKYAVGQGKHREFENAI